MKKIKLTRGRFALVDDEDFEKVSKYKWQCSPSSYASSANFINSKKKRKFPGIDKISIFLHRFIFDEYKKENLYVDHIDGNPLNNQKFNLRYATNQQNQANSKISKNNKSGYKGVCWDKVNKKWIAQIMINGKSIKIGRFKSKEEAYKQYCQKGRELFREFFKDK